jgi:hypothetical protein
MAYEAVAAGVGDRSPFFGLRNLALRPLRRLALRQAQKMRFEVVEELKKIGIDSMIVNGGGTGDLNWVGSESTLTEVTVGSGYLCGQLFGYYSNLKLERALVLGLPVTRSPRAGVVTTLGGGFVASGVPGWDRLPAPAEGMGLRYFGSEGAGEVQTPFAGENINIGDFVFVHPAKSGEIAERFNSYALVQGGAVVDRVLTYRGHGVCYF